MGETKTCPLRWLMVNGTSEGRIACSREGCQWWVLCRDGSGTCAIEFMGIALAEQAGYVLATEPPEPKPELAIAADQSDPPAPITPAEWETLPAERTEEASQ